ncbi:hypothetical protein A2773_05500 [Candidatus Gottesmanbacteria bacterium RIFCSPHIGHO2_01_FULL_39_10]|uniref:Uncharacterized protein n=1 Tax=Candidatus Gottesmanbacteria bacterium RIFCSPHIGHO2_01_FULL_39_10 TaxID=1798375 RepID=A0A1F5ZPU1_9BACT|nr:MAG: hypothetical protein A2773_05500 [Candidatus Gottesmanbacteria bacterium RIFCSPHIGHO2_01_FULL_39_10]
MIFSSISFFIFLLSIFFLVPHINTAVYHLVLLLTRSKKIALGILLFILLPGTIIHELSHFLVATLLFVRTGELTVIPKVEEESIKAGSLKHANTDPIKRTLIGIAPMIIGLIIIYFLGNIIFNQFSNFPLLIANSYLLIAVSLSMFSSKKDLEVAIFVVPIFALIMLALYLNGLTVTFSQELYQKISHVLSQLNIYLLLALGLDIVVFLSLKSLIIIFQRLLKVKIVS